MEEECTQNINLSTLAPRRNNQLAKLISERPQGSLPSNTISNPKKQLNEITVRDKEGLVEPEPESRQGIVVSKGKGEVDHNEQKSETRSRSRHKPCSSNNKGPIYEERRLQIEELDEWRAQKLRTHDKPKLHHDGLNVSPNQLKVRDKVLLDAADPRITTFEPNGTIPFTSKIFPNTGFDTLPQACDMAVSNPAKSTQGCATRPRPIPVVKTVNITQAANIYTGAGEANEAGHG
ncbi:hypothetical protein GOBAR_AA00397 [Gossypium barbadense]|uniref:Uncharacterized protein n=1 Tax=Gossypium barbadense TaxID=3634 RepID=A0A2P5YX77_GOSBA|nr:hypothetical protein GOBAR_AA00397 [Gossypium barbadense]